MEMIVSSIPGLLGTIVGAAITSIAIMVRERRRYSAAVDVAHSEAIQSVENKIDEQILELYGIDIDKVDNADNSTPKQKGITAARICYVTALVNAQSLRFGRNHMGKYIKATDLKMMWHGEEDYMPRFFSFEINREVWRHARRCFRKALRDNVDDHLLEKYHEEFVKRPLERL